MNILTQSFNAIYNSIVSLVIAYLPRLISGVLILLIGLIIASLMRDLIGIVFKYLRVEKVAKTIGVASESEVTIWPQILSEIARWTIIFIFLMSAIEVWGVPKVSEVMNQLLLFLPNVILAVVIGWVGLILGRLAFDIVRHGVRGLGSKESFLLGNVARYAIIFFTSLIILTQLGVAADLIKILFTGIVGMLTLAFGLAFGLGGQDEAKELLKKFRERIASPYEKINKKK